MTSKITVAHDTRNKKKPHVVRWYGEYDPSTGKQRRYAKSFRLKVEAEQFAAEKTVEFRKGSKRDRPVDIPLHKFCKEWLRGRKPELRPKSIEVYENTIIRLEEYFGKDTSLQSIDPQKATIFIAEQKYIAKGHEGDKLSDSSRDQIKRNCKAIFNGAVEWGLLTSNPFRAIRLKKLTPKRWYRVSPKEYQALLEVVSLRERVAYALLYTAGLRLSEAFSLTWSDVNFESTKLIIANREATATLPPFHVKDHETRQIPLPKHTVDLLTQYQTQAPEGVPYILLTEKRFAIVKAKWDQLKIKKKPWLNRYMINNVLRNFKGRCKRTGIQPIGTLTIHTLRKCAGQNWADYLPMNVVKELMGHSTIVTTQKYYSQVDADHEAKAAAVIQSLLENESDVKQTYEAILGNVEGV